MNPTPYSPTLPTAGELIQTLSESFRELHDEVSRLYEDGGDNQETMDLADRHAETLRLVKTILSNTPLRRFSDAGKALNYSGTPEGDGLAYFIGEGGFEVWAVDPLVADVLKARGFAPLAL